MEENKELSNLKKRNRLLLGTSIILGILALGGLITSICLGVKPGSKTFYVVNFNTLNGSFIEAQSVEKGKFATKPSSNPTKDGYDFGGWFINEQPLDGESVFNFSTKPINEDTTLYARWIHSDEKVNLTIQLENCHIIGSDSSTYTNQVAPDSYLSFDIETENSSFGLDPTCISLNSGNCTYSFSPNEEDYHKARLFLKVTSNSSLTVKASKSREISFIEAFQYISKAYSSLDTLDVPTEFKYHEKFEKYSKGGIQTIEDDFGYSATENAKYIKGYDSKIKTVETQNEYVDEYLVPFEDNERNLFSLVSLKANIGNLEDTKNSRTNKIDSYSTTSDEFNNSFQNKIKNIFEKKYANGFKATYDLFNKCATKPEFFDFIQEMTFFGDYIEPENNFSAKIKVIIPEGKTITDNMLYLIIKNGKISYFKNDSTTKKENGDIDKLENYEFSNFKLDEAVSLPDDANKPFEWGRTYRDFALASNGSVDVFVEMDEVNRTFKALPLDSKGDAYESISFNDVEGSLTFKVEFQVSPYLSPELITEFVSLTKNSFTLSSMGTQPLQDDDLTFNINQEDDNSPRYIVVLENKSPFPCRLDIRPVVNK